MTAGTRDTVPESVVRRRTVAAAPATHSPLLTSCRSSGSIPVMFWQFENWSASQIDKVLEKEVSCATVCHQTTLTQDARMSLCTNCWTKTT